MQAGGGLLGEMNGIANLTIFFHFMHFVKRKYWVFYVLLRDNIAIVVE